MDDGPPELIDAIQKRRGGKLLNLDRMLLNSPPFAQGWNGFIGTVRSGLSISLKLQELAMCVVASLNRAEYEFIHHGPVFLRAGGSQVQLEALRDPSNASALFDEQEQAVLNLAIEMTRDVQVTSGTHKALSRHFTNRETVELIGVVAAYNMVSRFLVATGVEPES
jgi:alkylhydroperoxidase family enzyme